MKQINIRYATRQDFQFIVDCQLNMACETEGLELDREIVTPGVEAVFDDPLKGFYIVGEEIDNNADVTGHSEFATQAGTTVDATKRLCSCLMITPEWSDWRNNKVWWIQSVYVLPKYRESGVFRMMYSFIKSLVSERQDVAGIRLYVDNTNLRARDVYKRIGMTDEHYRVFEWMKGY
ncbi:MAG TPA: GNAT family N-acetyltransferase [Lentimicrobium sp.]|nr:GNAT family N-acetyltransferase [Lentimicrobium sp.]